MPGCLLAALLAIGCSANDADNPFGATGGASSGTSHAGGSSTGGNSTGGASAAGGEAGSSVGGAPAGGAAGSSGHGGAAGVAGTNTCDYESFDSTREPGAILIVFDASASMRENVDGEDTSGSEPSKWMLATEAVRNMVDALPDGTLMGVMLFPSSGCDIDSNPAVAVAPLSETRDAIKSTLSASYSPDGDMTPLAHAIAAGHIYLHGRSDLTGEKAILLVTDGAPSTFQPPLGCGEPESETPQNAGLGLTNWQQKTYVIGLAGSNESLLSQAAFNGGTPRTDTCTPTCNSAAQCCHYIADGSNTQSALVEALSELASSFLTSCVFTVPQGDDPDDFDPGLVNVYVTLPGQDAALVLYNMGGAQGDTGWKYTDDTHTSVEILGDLCQQILSNESKVEIALGCPSAPIQ